MLQHNACRQSKETAIHTVQITRDAVHVVTICNFITLVRIRQQSQFILTWCQKKARKLKIKQHCTKVSLYNYATRDVQLSITESQVNYKSFPNPEFQILNLMYLTCWLPTGFGQNCSKASNLVELKLDYSSAKLWCWFLVAVMLIGQVLKTGEKQQHCCYSMLISLLTSDSEFYQYQFEFLIGSKPNKSSTS